MKNKILFLSFLTLSTLSQGASIDHIMNYTPEYNANPALQGAINTSSTVNYNPAGLMRLENGLYLNGAVQLAQGRYQVLYGGKNHDTDLLSPVGNFSLFKKYDKYALYWTFGGIAGGAAVDYEDGISKYTELTTTHPLFQFATINSSYGKGGNRYLQTTVGTAFDITPRLSGAIGGRLVHGRRDFQGEVNATIPGAIIGATGTLPINAYTDSEREALGLGIQLGLNYKATEKLNLGLRFDSKVKLNFETKGTATTTAGIDPNNDLFGSMYPEYKDGAKSYRDLPAILALGAQYEVTNSWKVYSGITYYFNQAANIDDGVEMTEGASRTYKDGYELAIGSEYQINTKLAWLAGMNYSVTGASLENYHDSEYALDSIMVGTGVKYQYSEKITLIGSLSHYFYLPESSTTRDFKKRMTALGMGFTYKF